jgi:hypothetical protein
MSHSVEVSDRTDPMRGLESLQHLDSEGETSIANINHWVDLAEGASCDGRSAGVLRRAAAGDESEHSEHDWRNSGGVELVQADQLDGRRDRASLLPAMAS